MLPVYLGFAAAIVLIFLIFLAMRLKAQHDAGVAVATPTPGPNATQSPIPLRDGASLGKPSLAPGNEKGGGFGAAVDSIECQTMEQARMHVHGHLALFVDGTQIEVPRYIGIVPSESGTCLYWLHTHDGSGILHVESPEFRQYTLGNLFDIWGEDLSRSHVGPFAGPVTAFVNGAKWSGDLGAIPLSAHQQITLEVGRHIVPPPNYAFPAGD
ncbi:MAG: hypothetical protein DLM50_02915 [Candidatus Meridianibacter frigidus]|nr:MAG: hypothetical protein DLM50_02915 [Candidatus Eremiobacteraeota bacterium]